MSEGAARALMRLWPVVISVLRRGRVPDGDVPDVAQEVLIRVLPWWSQRTPAELADVAEACRGYVRVVARGMASRHVERRRRAEGPGGAEPFDEDRLYFRAEGATAPSPEELWIEREEAAERAREVGLEVLRGATTPERWRAFRGHFVDGVSVVEIAGAEGVTAGTIYHRITLARLDLRAAILRRRGGRNRPR